MSVYICLGAGLNESGWHYTHADSPLDPCQHAAHDLGAPALRVRLPEPLDETLTRSQAIDRHLTLLREATQSDLTSDAAYA